MSGTPAETIRIAMEYESRKVAVLLAENQRLDAERDMLRRSLEGEMAEKRRLREALEWIASCDVVFTTLVAERFYSIAREALAGDTE